MIGGYSRRREMAQLASALFERAWFRGVVKRLWARVTGKPRAIPLLRDARARYREVKAQPPVRASIRISRIIGSEGTLNFDCEFLPIDRHQRNRWISVAEMLLDDPTGVPAIQAVQVEDTYYVIDGHHRVSVARMLDHLYLDADVTVWQTM
jgi:hypothetical protein